MRQFRLLSLFVIPVFLLTGCTSPATMMQPTHGTQTPPYSIPPATATTLRTLTLTPAIADTELPVPTVTVKLSTPTLSFTATPTPVDTLEPTQAMETIQPLLKDPLNCAVPCFFGITPGNTYLDDVRNFFSPLGLKHDEGTDPNSGMYFYSVGFESNIGRDSSAIFFTANSMVKNIVVEPEITKQTEGSQREWIAYSPETLIKKYGQPSLVVFFLDWGQMYSTALGMVMYFNDVNLIILYYGRDMFPHEPHPLFCPLTAPFELVELWIGPNPPILPSYEYNSDANSLEVATSLTMDQFTQMMLGDPQQACFTLNGDMFPN
jgi:hypothetical protein